MKSVLEVVSRFRRHCKGCPASTAMDLFNTAYKRLLDKAQLRITDVTFSSIVDGTREYDWAEADLRCWGVTWYKSATDFWELTPTSEDALRDPDGAWKERTDEGDPSTFYIAARKDTTAGATGKLVIGFDLIPDTTTTGGYPKAVAHCTQHTTISGSTVLPYSLLDEMYFVYYMCEMWCEETGDFAKADYWRKRRIADESIQIEHVKNLSANSEETRILPAYGPFTTSIT